MLPRKWLLCCCSQKLTLAKHLDLMHSPLLRLPLTPKLLSKCPAPAASPHSPATHSSTPVPWLPPSPPTATNEGQADLLRAKFPTLFLVVNSLDPLCYLALGCLSCGQERGISMSLPPWTGTFSLIEREEQLKREHYYYFFLPCYMIFILYGNTHERHCLIPDFRQLSTPPSRQHPTSATL